MSDRRQTGEQQALQLNNQNAGTLRDGGLCPFDYVMLGISFALFLAGAALTAQTRAEISSRRFSKKLIAGLLLMLSAFCVRPIFNYLFACSPSAHLFS